ncbi:DAYSLEEPER [Hibiscus trionum]|uniref:DAYSLEEPER n=1 Tax=Hibiscus trionum TaxID=183268 RepID=A0A9W7LIR6_HIBTR|nr:DAYSLEEPER [Hibiscus trionum]
MLEGDVNDQLSETVRTSKRKSTASTGGDIGRRTSPVWDHYTFIKLPEGLFAECKYCKTKRYKANSYIGTSNPKRHTEKCKSYKEFLATNPNSSSETSFDQKRYCELFSEAILCHGYALSVVEHDKLRVLHNYLNLNVKDISRYSITKACMLKHEMHKKLLIDSMHSVVSRICFTCDGWSACTSRSYFALTTHYVDNNWKLLSKILNFHRFPPPRDGESIYKFVKNMLTEWGLEKRAFTITLDNASANERIVRRLKDDLHAISPFPCNGKFFHIRCATHILNLIVQKGLKVIDSSVIKLREIVKFIDSSDSRLCCFDSAINDCGSDFSGKLVLDVPTRWNSTYLMLRRALEAKHAINLFVNRENGLDIISEVEWETAQLICDFLEPFFEISTLFSGSKYPTTNLYLANVIAIEKLLCDAHNDPCEGISAMAGPMLELYEKYWSDHSTILTFSVLLDPRYKLQLLKELYDVLYVEDEVERRVSVVYNEFVSMYIYYSRSARSSSSNSSVQSNSSQSSSLSSSGCPRTFKKSNLFQNFDANLAASRSGKSDVDSYISFPLLPRTEDAEFDILEYWKTQSVSFPILSLMARDVLTIPITSIASKSSFSMGVKF